MGMGRVTNISMIGSVADPRVFSQSRLLSRHSGSQHEMITSLPSLRSGPCHQSSTGSSVINRVTMSLQSYKEESEEEQRSVVTGTCNHLFTAYRKFRYRDSKVKSRSK